MTAPNLPRTEMTIAHVFLEHAEFSHRRDPLEMKSPGEKPASPPPAEIIVTLRIADDRKSVAVRLQAELDNPDHHYAFSVAYVVIFAVVTEALDLTADESKPLRDRMTVTGAGVAMPFVREMVANMTGRGRFGPQWLNPINFAKQLLKPENQGQLVPPTL